MKTQLGSKTFVQQKFKKSSRQLGACPFHHNADLPVVALSSEPEAVAFISSPYMYLKKYIFMAISYVAIGLAYSRAAHLERVCCHYVAV